MSDLLTSMLTVREHDAVLRTSSLYAGQHDCSPGDIRILAVLRQVTQHDEPVLFVHALVEIEDEWEAETFRLSYNECDILSRIAPTHRMLRDMYKD